MAAVREVRVVEHEELAGEVAELVVWLAEQVLAHRPVFRMALSGGSTPKALHHVLAGTPVARRVAWPRVEFYFGDERCVPPDHPESNARMAEETLFRPLGISPDRVFRMMGEATDPEHAAQAYEALLRARCAAPAPAWPRLDLILLGLGDDGHTASLFPASPALNEATRAVVAARSPRGVARRLTVTPPLINHAETIIVLVTGESKAAAVRAVLEEEVADAKQYPAKLIQPVDGRLVWYLDRAAASQLAIARQQITFDEA